MRALRLLCLAASIALTSVAPARAQPAMSAGSVNQLQDVEIQEQLIALGVLDATAGQASRDDLRKAVEWFRRAYQSAPGVEPLSDDEKEKLKQTKAKFYATTGLKEVTYKDPKTETDLRLLVPLKFVATTPQKFDGSTPGGDWQEYRDNVSNVAVGPVIHLLSDFTPIALFRQNVMQVALNYKRLHLTSEEFAAVGDAEDKERWVRRLRIWCSRPWTSLRGCSCAIARSPPNPSSRFPIFSQRSWQPSPRSQARLNRIRRPEAGSS